MQNRVGRSLGVWLLMWLLPLTSVSAADCTPWAAKVASVQGEVEVKQARAPNWHPVIRNDTFCPGDSIRTGVNSRAVIILANETLLRLDQNSAIKLIQFETAAPSILEFIKGIGHFISREPRSLKIETPTVNAAIEGTEFVITVSADETRVTVFEGTVLTQNQLGEVRITDGETVITKANTAPVKTLLAKPRDAVQWALYFPPIIEMDKPNKLSRASRLLYVGRVKEAQTLLQGMDSGEALALQTIIAIVNNEKDRAFKLATDAVQQSPQSAAPHIAMSYAWQAKLELKQALSSAQQAVKNEPNNAIAWARLAELKLSTGDLDEALASAQQATQLNANLSRTQSILGYAYLVRIEIETAINTFVKAIELDQVDPLPRLGLGLARIRNNDLAEGRREIEIAASLDPNNAIIRSYLGKAYFEEKRDPLDADQFAMAKDLDPNDPTAFFYDAIRKQTQNDPVAALEDLNKSIELNDNRAVYRSSLQLDQDQAARQASIASIYRDLNFNELAQIEAYNSLNKDFTNASAHRFLAESLNDRNRHEIARASEGLQALLLSPIALNPVPPSMSEANSGTLPNAGPGQASFNEYNNLFVRDNSLWNISAVAGNQQTSGDEIVYSALYSNTVMSIGQYHYQTAGFRQNNDLQQDIFNLFLHTAITPNQSLQFEFKSNDKDFGDRRLNFDPTNFSDNRREIREEDSYRLGYYAKLTLDSHLLASFINQDTIFSRNETTQVSPVGPFGPVIATSSLFSDFSTHSTELQYILNKNTYQMILGAGDYHQDQFQNDVVAITSGGVPIGGGSTLGNFSTTHSNGYVYNYFDLDGLDLTLGVSNDDLDDPIIHVNQANGKLGLQWDVTNNIRLRTAAFRTLKRSLTSNQTIEPTQVAGFNQFYDDILGTDATNYGFAMDTKIAQNLYAGIEFLHRYLDIPIESSGAIRIEEQNEYLDRLYLHWLINNNFSFTIRYEFEKYKRELQSTGSVNIPSTVITKSIPLNLTYTSSNQFFTGLTATYVDQRVVQPLSFGPLVLTHNEDTFWALDYELGYRLPQRTGTVSFLVNNLTDEEFNYQDTNFRTGLEKNPRFSHTRTYLLKLTINLE